MYNREIKPSRPTPFESGNPIEGTWIRPFDDVNLLSIPRPFALPLPKWLRNYRIKEWQSFQISDARYCLTATLTNAKFYRMAQVVLYDTETKEKLHFRKVLPFGAWHLPRSLSNSSITSRSQGFLFRIHNWLDADLMELDLDIESRKDRPSFTAHIEFDMQRTLSTPIVVCLPFSDHRCMYSYKALSPIQGDLVFGGRHISLTDETASGLFCDYKGFYPYRMRGTWASAAGFNSDGKRFGFSIAENQANNPAANNENALWIGEKMFPLPPVRITQGNEGGWVIQDLEGMVDLTFSPKESSSFNFDFFLTCGDYQSPLGIFNGMLLSPDGDKIQIKNLWGLGEKLYLRV